MLAGRDLEAGGTWLGFSRQGRFAALTNYREGAKQRLGAPSRGALASDFLTQRVSAETYLAELATHGGDFNGFNLCVSTPNRNVSNSHFKSHA